MSSVSVNITATRFLRELGDGPEPLPLGRPAPERRPPQDAFFFAFAFITGFRADPVARFVFVVFLRAAIFFP